jgi:hypothetical protein
MCRALEDLEPSRCIKLQKGGKPKRSKEDGKSAQHSSGFGPHVTYQSDVRFLAVKWRSSIGAVGEAEKKRHVKGTTRIPREPLQRGNFWRTGIFTARK